MKKSELYAALCREIHRHDFSTYVDEPPSVAEGGPRRPDAWLQFITVTSVTNNVLFGANQVLVSDGATWYPLSRLE